MRRFDFQIFAYNKIIVIVFNVQFIDKYLMEKSILQIKPLLIYSRGHIQYNFM